MNYHKNDLIDELLVRYYSTFAHTLDTGDYVPDKYNKKILNYIFKNMKRAFRKIDWENWRWQRKHKKDILAAGAADTSQEITQSAETQENQNIEVESNG
ncbi:MAG: hypothetical protein NC131_00340 [Roseburia sp.]|nr:hypothetical protein [Roseburia sp.]